MRLSKLVLFFVLAFSLTTHAEDNVMIDLSVLDGLGESFSAPSKPLFPTLPKKTKPVNKPKITSKKRATKSANSVAKSLNVKESIVVVDVEPTEGSNDVYKEKTNKLKSINKANKKVQVVDIKPVKSFDAVSDEKTNMLNGIENKSNEEVNVVDVEPVIPNNVVSNEEVAKKELAEEVDISQYKEISTENTTSELLINDEITGDVVNTSNNVIVFEDGIYELTQEQITKVDEIIKKFNDPNAHKIAIYSYNLDDGIDTFKKKRTSLNRAVEIRSYLIKQGYKNFSIKVINVNTNSDKINTVELEEI